MWAARNTDPGGEDGYVQQQILDSGRSADDKPAKDVRREPAVG
jgi:hypothetical protein